MKQFFLKSILVIAALMIAGLGVIIPPSSLGFADYSEECLGEGCDHEEAGELTEVYNEECIQESCDQEEIQETFGIPHFPNFSEYFYNKWERGVHSTDSPTSNQAWNAKTLDLGESLFAPINNKDDNDNDYLADSLEHKLAEEFKPLLIFDSDENARLPNEPVTLFQIRPRGCIGGGCNNIYTIDIKYLFLWQWDGGYGPDSSCGNSHEGDNQAIDLVLQSKDGHRWKLTYLNIWTGGYGFQKEWSLDSNGNDNRHFHLYLSAGKHHHFFDTTYDHEDTPFGVPSPFSPCNEDVNGGGARIQPKLSDTYCFPSGICKEVPLNVGESNAHSTEYFINDLSSLGYQGENAWGQQPFRGGLGGDSDDTAANSTIWIKAEELKYVPGNLTGTNWISCQPVNVAVFSSRVHVKCASYVGNGIIYFATSTQDPLQANLMLKTFTDALVGNHLLSILYDPSDTSGSSFGCQAKDCRISMAAAILQ